MAYQKELTTKVYMTPEAHAKQAALVERCDKEIVWFGVVEEGPDGFPLVVDILVPKQIVTGGSVDGGKDEGAEYSLAAFLAENAAVVPKLKYNGHSHVNMSCYASVTDLEQIETWFEYGMPYMISHIQNKKGETYTRLDMFQGIPVSAPVVVEILHPGGDPIIKWADDVIAENVEQKTYKSYPRVNSGPVGGANGSFHDDWASHTMGRGLPVGESARDAVDKFNKDHHDLEEVDTGESEHAKVSATFREVQDEMDREDREARKELTDDDIIGGHGYYM